MSDTNPETEPETEPETGLATEAAATPEPEAAPEAAATPEPEAAPEAVAPPEAVAAPEIPPATKPNPHQKDEEAFERLQKGRDQVKAELGKVIIGQDAVIDQILLTLLCGGHCLLTGAPGLAKTLLVKSVAQIFQLKFSRIVYARSDASRHHRYRNSYRLTRRQSTHFCKRSCIRKHYTRR